MATDPSCQASLPTLRPRGLTVRASQKKIDGQSHNWRSHVANAGKGGESSRKGRPPRVCLARPRARRRRTLRATPRPSASTTMRAAGDASATQHPPPGRVSPRSVNRSQSSQPRRRPRPRPAAARTSRSPRGRDRRAQLKQRLGEISPRISGMSWAGARRSLPRVEAQRARAGSSRAARALRRRASSPLDRQRGSPVHGECAATRASPESTTATTPSTVMDVSATLVERMILRVRRAHAASCSSSGRSPCSGRTTGRPAAARTPPARAGSRRAREKNEHVAVRPLTRRRAAAATRLVPAAGRRPGEVLDRDLEPAPFGAQPRAAGQEAAPVRRPASPTSRRPPGRAAPSAASGAAGQRQIG